MTDIDELYDFVQHVFGMNGSCSFTCDYCKKTYQACNGEYADDKGFCPNDDSGCPSGSLDFDRFSYNGGKQVCEDCFEKVFGVLKRIIDSRRSGILMYIGRRIREERKSLEYDEELLKEANK